ncbi:hypothetical protein HN789_04125 [archaeon]|jgi:uncharacterized membrane protein|nr:hypothetical protein [archaeon]MBT4022489.1 hypothetical protein [archaeon]MBT4272328.1 hypothetical protein [archaeon]MBT4460437.1 hypothetical protein [archaeon]MBT4858456.1 hypothetical protein [archaeon]
MSKNSQEGKICVILLWLTGWVGLIWYLVDEKMKKNSFVKFHLKQWLMALIVSMIWSFVFSIVYFLLSIVTFGIFAIFGWIGYFIPVVWLIQGLIFAIKDEEKELWLIGKYAKKYFKF